MLNPPPTPPKLNPKPYSIATNADPQVPNRPPSPPPPASFLPSPFPFTHLALALEQEEAIVQKQVERQVKKEVHEEVARREAAALQESRSSELARQQALDSLGAPALQDLALGRRWDEAEEGEARRSVSRDLRREEDLMNDASGEMM